MKKLMAVLILVLIVMLSAAPKSEALCTIYGRIVYASTNGGNYTVYVAPIPPSGSVLSPYYFIYTTVDPEVISTLNAAQAGNLKVLITGNITACPTTGTSRPGGVITSVGVF
jgi:phosphatidylethanolamine-binding protein (PEBP) family uncharacterized protein